MNCKSYIPGNYATRGLNKERGNTWPIYYDNKLLNGYRHNSHNSCMFSSLNGYSEYDKEMLKRTMLEQEAIFRKQVYELHRLYRIQKDLMEDFQKNDLCRVSTWKVESKSSLSSSEAQSQVTGRIWQMYDQPSLSSSQSRETTTVTNTNVSPISTLQSCFGALENGAPGRDGESNASFRASTKRMFDLQVPADAYIDTEETERSEKEEILGLSSVTTVPYSSKCKGDPENELKLTLANVSNANGGVCKYDSHRKNSLFHCLADLNETFEDLSMVETAYSFPSQHFGLETKLVENHRPNGSLRSTNLWLQNSSSKNWDYDESRPLPEGKKDISQANFQFLSETGKSKFDLSLDFGKEKCSMSFEPIKPNEILLKDLNKAETLFVQKGNSLEIPRKGSGSTVSENHKKLASLNINAPPSPLLPAWMNPSGGEKQSSAQFQAVSSFDKSSTMTDFRIFEQPTNDPSGFCDRLQFCGDLRSVSYSNLNLNSRESCSFDIQDRVTAPKICDELSPELVNNPNCNESLSLSNRLSSRIDLCFSTSGLGNEGALEIETPVHSCNLGDFQSKLHCSEEKTERNEVPNLNFLNERRQQVDELQHGSVFRDINPRNTEKELSGEENSRSLRNQFDLNCEATFMDEPKFSKMLANSPVCGPSQISDVLSKASPLIDMDAPVMSLEENNIPDSSHDVLVKEAAENMIMLSNNVQSYLSSEPPCGMLHWLAEVAMLNTPKHTKNSYVEMDLFELMTLQLEEMKPEETRCSRRETANARDDEKSRALLLFKKPRRGQARKRRQRRDFMKDTLPGLASLSKKEIVEDLQLIGGLMKASGFHWEASTGRRNGGRNDMPAKAKRKQLPRRTTNAVTKEHSRPQQTLFLFSKSANNPEFEVDRPSVVGWGKTTRRRRRPRCHPPPSVTKALT